MSDRDAPDHQRDLERYVDQLPAPSVITPNDVAAAEAAHHFMLTVPGLHANNSVLG